MNNKPVTVYGDGSKVRDFVYAGYVSKAIMYGIGKQISGIFNVGTGVGTTTLQLLETIKKVLDKKAEIIWEKERIGDSRSRIVSINKLKTQIGFSPETTLEKGITYLREYLMTRLNVA
ncbi:hypothetical protein SUSAZ_08625 [Sulfolobus acidocaldarius SUSAZ]|nr:hypothetical protein SUSAZ_08625 [Sulfolobus acidocaldarius SUSAZ]